MEFGKHLGAGAWGLADKMLPSVYGVGMILFVIRTFPPVEFGIYTIIQTLLLLFTAVGQNFALQPLVKFGAETDDLSAPTSASGVLYGLFLAAISVPLVVFAGPFGGLLKSDEAGALMVYVPVMLAAAFPRNVAAFLLQARLRLRTLFILDAIHSLGSLSVIAVLVQSGKLSTAEGVLVINLITLGLSSVFGLFVLFGTYRVRPAVTREALGKVWNYGRYSLGGSVSYMVYAQSDNLIISALLGPVSVAIYNAAKVFARVFDFLLQLTTTLLVPVVSRAHQEGRKGDLLVIAEKSLLFFTLFSGAFAVIFILFGGTIIGLLYDETYAESAGVLRVLGVAGFMIPAVAVSASFCLGTGEVRSVFRLNLAMAVVGIGLVYLLTLIGGPAGTAWAICATFAIVVPLWLRKLVNVVGIPVTLRGVTARYADVTSFVRRMADRV